jgi:hypothetical protein
VPTVEPSYSFTVGTVTDPQTGDLTLTYALVAPTIFPNNLTKTSGEGKTPAGNTCEGDVSLYSTDGKTVWSFQPVASIQPAPGAMATLSGIGLYRIYATDQWTGQ